MGLNSTAFTTEKTAVLAPMPRASVRIRTGIVKPGFLPSMRTAYRKFCPSMASVGSSYSYLSASMGSIRLARRASDRIERKSFMIVIRIFVYGHTQPCSLNLFPVRPTLAAAVSLFTSQPCSLYDPVAVRSRLSECVTWMMVVPNR